MLFEFEQKWGEEGIAFGEKHAKEIDTWPAPLRQRAYAHFSAAYGNADENEARGNAYAWRAVQLGNTDLLDGAVAHLVAKRRYAEAERLLAQAPPAKDMWDARNRIEIAMTLPDKRVAVREVARHDAKFGKDIAQVAAQALVRSGDVAAAQARLAGAKPRTEEDRQAFFDVALAAHDLPLALGTIDFGDTDSFLENLGRFVMLATHAPSTLSSPTMMAGTMLFLILLAAIALIPGLMLLAGLAIFPGLLFIPAHYRGLARRVRNKPATPLFERVNLLHAWYAAAIMVCVPVIVQVFVAPASFADLLNGDSKIMQSPALFSVMWWGTLAGLACLLPGARWIGAARLVGDRAMWRSGWWKVLVATACVWGVGLLLALYHGATGGGGDTMHTQLLDSAAQTGRATFGAFATFLLIAVIVPVFEELTFRGLVLGGLTRHIGFWWANIAQALTFATIHDDPPRFVFYFAMGAVAGWLVKSTKSLAPAIALHMINNATVYLLAM
jgi:membrane protease YdiL (CAAX protease family)